MAIDIATETIIPIQQAPKHIPGRPHISTVYRWIQRRENALDVVRYGSKVFTSLEAIARFGVQNNSPAAQVPPSRHRAKRVAAIDRELIAAGIM